MTKKEEKAARIIYLAKYIGRLLESSSKAEAEAVMEVVRCSLAQGAFEVSCENCHQRFTPWTAHKRKFCSPLCAKQATAREWARKNRKVA